MKLGDIVREIPGQENCTDANVEILSLAYDSRRVRPGSLFFAITGDKADGHAHIPAALEQGTVAIVSELPAPVGLATRWVRVPKIRRALADASRAFYGHPEAQLQLIGITGTNGKTTAAFLLESVLRIAGSEPGLFGTIEYRVAGRTVEAPRTTPESLDLIALLAELVEAGGKAAVMEVSSHALAQERVWGLHFSAAVFTNLTRDHLDYHGDMEHYFVAKRRLFEGLGTAPPELAVVNQDDPWSARLLEVHHERQITYGWNAGAQVRVKQFTQSLAGIRASIETPEGRLEVESPLVGRANLANILAVIATGVGLGIPQGLISDGIAALKAVPGRFQNIDEGQPFLVVVDYAHTDDALRNVLKTARELTDKRLIVVFGCGGERDRTKRPLMGEAAGSLCDFTVLTSDNPRGEDPLLIISDALVGVQKTGKPYLAEVDREVAVRKALEYARERDVVVIAGKGHETYQVLKDGNIPFDDRIVARRILNELGYSSEKRDER